MYLALVAALSAAFIGGALALGANGNYLAGMYMFGPALAAILTRAIAHRPRFRGAGLHPGPVRAYLPFWAFGLGVVAANFLAIQIAGAVRWDLTGDAALARIDQLAAQTGQGMPDPPAGMTPRDMLLLFTVGGITLFNILPGLLIGFGEEFGWRGLMFPALYRLRPWLAVVVGGLIWYAWHVPLLLVVPSTAAGETDPLSTAVRIVALAVGAIATHTVFAYAYARSGSIWIASLVHGTIDNASRSGSYWVIVVDQYRADVAVAVSMVVVVALLAATGELRWIPRFFGRSRTATA